MLFMAGQLKVKHRPIIYRPEEGSDLHDYTSAGSKVSNYFRSRSEERADDLVIDGGYVLEDEPNSLAVLDGRNDGGVIMGTGFAVWSLEEKRAHVNRDHSDRRRAFWLELAVVQV